jgi:aspartyl-tRNA(Asn)/glutamyl-tRNA(Gln) amidotransferase subunit C
MATRISKEDVLHVSRLARLELESNDIELYRGQLEAILALVDAIDKEGLEKVTPMAHAGEVTNVMRADEPGQVLDRDLFLRSCPSASEGYVAIPPILGGQD